MYIEITELNTALKYCLENVEFYKKTLRKVVPAGGISSIKEFQNLPFTTKEDVKRCYPYGMMGAKLSDISLYHESSGTSGGDSNRSSRANSFNTKRDIELDLKRRVAGDLKFNDSDIVFNALPYAFTSSGVNFHKAAVNAGAMVVPADNGSALSSYRKQVDVIRRMKPTVILTSYPFVFSTLFKMFRAPIEELDTLRAIQLCGMASSKEGRNKISKLFNGVPVYNTYGMSEFGAITATCKCKHSHVNEGFYIEIINPKTLEPMPKGEGGEIVITTLNREGSPKIRFRTGDIGKMIYEKCECGRSSPRLETLGRLKDLIEINDKRLTLSDFENVFYKHDATMGMYKLEFLEEGNMKITIDVEGDDKTAISKELKDMVKAELEVDIEFECVDVGQSRKELLAQQSNSIKSLQSVDGAGKGEDEWLVTY